MKTMVALLFIFLPVIAGADCIYNGKQYPEGTTIAGLVCQADGSWE